eukprot:TRINITY_DN1287_c0_g1_i1.p1 TRINITY_DN1287_c0_g1~~TRINITY_DN1287_c0_g1_i1.p1  ORF type:complete len:978 (+),score=154.69 TRINITY_DN1287_c0_g1_i1:525-3458(+)
MVPPNPPRLTLNYDSSTTDEGKLKAAVLRRSERRTVAVLATGKGGVGKTCGLRGLGEDNEIKRAFGGGILYMELGNDATIRGIIQGIANIVKRTGGAKLAKLIGTRKFVAEASQEASKWFSERQCLFLVDDVWHVNGIDSAVLEDIGRSVGTKSVMVYSTRERYFVRDATELVEFKEKEAHGELSRQMLLTHAGFDQNVEYKKENKEAFENLLSVCQGLPLGFGIIGCSVREYALDCEPREDAWSEFYGEVVSQHKMLMTTETKSYGTIPQIVDSSLHVLGKRNGHRKFRHWFRALSVVQKQQCVPVEMLQKLWSFGTLEETKAAVKSFADVSVVEMRRKRGSMSLKLHDLILDVAIHQAAEQNEKESFYRTLVHNYMECGEGKHKDDSWRGAMNDSDWELCYAWWEVEDDGYIRSNVCRLLRNAGYVKQLIWLLLQPQWIVKRPVEDGIQSLEKDLDHGSGVCSNAVCSQYADYEDHLRAIIVEDHLRAIGWAERMSLPFVNNNPRVEEARFQVHGRLLWWATQNELSREFVERMELFAPRPCLRASVGLLQQAGTGFLETVSVTVVLLCTLEEHDAMWILSHESNSGAMYVKGYDSHNGRYEKKLRMDRRSAVECASFLRDQLRAVTAHSDGRIRVWDTHTGVCQRVVECKSEAHKCVVQFLANGSLVACQMSDLSLQVRHSLSSKPAVQPLRGHTDWVMCVAMSTDGRRIVSRSRDHTVRVWNACTGIAVGQPLRGHKDWVRCLAVSTDGSRIVSGSDDELVLVWNAHTGSTIGQPLQGHTSWVRCVAVSADGSRIVSGSEDGTVRVWDAFTGSAVGQPLQGHTDRVTCVAVSADRIRIVSGSDDETVRVWNAHTGSAVGQPLEGHTATVRCVAVSADGTRIVSQDFEMLRLWEMNAQGAECVLTSRDAAWQRSIAVLELTWSGTERVFEREVRDVAEDDSEIVLGSCEQDVFNVGGGDVYFTKYMKSSCRILR